MNTKTIRRIFGAIKNGPMNLVSVNRERETWYDLAVREGFFDRVREKVRSRYAGWDVDIIRADEALETEIAAWSERAKLRYLPLLDEGTDLWPRSQFPGTNVSDIEGIYSTLWEAASNAQFVGTAPALPALEKEADASEEEQRRTLGLSAALISMLKDQAIRSFLAYFSYRYQRECAEGGWLSEEICQKSFLDYFTPVEIICRPYKPQHEEMAFNVRFPNLPRNIADIVIGEPPGVDFYISKNGRISYCIG